VTVDDAIEILRRRLATEIAAIAELKIRSVFLEAGLVRENWNF